MTCSVIHPKERGTYLLTTHTGNNRETDRKGRGLGELTSTYYATVPIFKLVQGKDEERNLGEKKNEEKEKKSNNNNKKQEQEEEQQEQERSEQRKEKRKLQEQHAEVENKRKKDNNNNNKRRRNKQYHTSIACGCRTR